VTATSPLSPGRVAALRAATPGCARRVHLNTAGAGLPSQQVLSAMTAHLARESLEGPMEAGAAVAPVLEELRALAARLINAEPADVAFASGCTHAWGVAFAALPPLRPGQRVLVSRHEWGSNLASLARAAHHAGVRLETMACAEDGSVDPEALARAIDERVALIALTWLPANGGLVNDAQAIGAVARAAGVPLLIDAAQALGQMPVDVQAVGCDLLVAPGRKHLRGPRGTALLYARPGFRERLQPAFLDVDGLVSDAGAGAVAGLRADARRLETGETSVAALLGLREAVSLALELGAGPIASRVRALAGLLREGLAGIDGVHLRDLGTQRSALVSFTLDRIGPQQLKQELARRAINIGANGVPYTPLDMRARGLDMIARMSVSCLTTEDEIARALAAVRELA
jgi:cysteine desulfurase / selenocysteine lyase